jgi:hypothetical protein
MRLASLLPLIALGFTLASFTPARPEPGPAELKAEYAKDIRPILQKYCLGCHSTKAKKGSLDLERFGTADDIRKDVKPWQGMIEQIETGEMPPKDKPQPTADEKKKLIAWVKNFLDAEAKANVGDPGRVPLRRLSNAEYDYTIRDLTGVDLKPTREFPADGAAGEGFTNAAEALTDISPALLTKYLAAAKDTADHAVFLPDGIRFSKGKTRRDWTDEQTAKLREFYSRFAPDGKLNFAPYLAATVKHRAALAAGKFDEVAAKEKLNAKYLTILWAALTDKAPSHPLDTLRAKWRNATEKDVAMLSADVLTWQSALWRTVRIGSYVQSKWGEGAGAGKPIESLTRQVPLDPPAAESVPLRFALKPVPGQSEVTLHLASRDLLPGDSGTVLWQRPRFEAPGKPPVLLKDYATFGPKHEFDFAVLFANADKYLAAVADPAAPRDGLDPEFLKRWTEVLALKPDAVEAGFSKPLRVIPAGPISLLDDPLPKDPNQGAINGWKKKGTDLPVAVSNSSGRVERIPGTIQPHGIGVHPMPQEYVAATWTSPSDTAVSLTATVTHAHAACGNGIGYRIEHRRGNSAGVLAEEAIPYGKEAKTPALTVKVTKGDVLLLAVEAKVDHTCDMTGLAFTIQETAGAKRTWDLSKDVADSILDGNPHADSHGNKAVWSFVRGASIPAAKVGPLVPPGSVLAQWKTVAPDPTKKMDSAKLAEQVRNLLSGPRPPEGQNRILFDNLVSFDSVLLQGLDLPKLGRSKGSFGLDASRFTGGDLVLDSGKVLGVRLPAALFRDREFVVDGKLAAPSDTRLVQFTIGTASNTAWDAKSPIVGTPGGLKQLAEGNARFRSVFPLYLCFQQIVPTDEVVSLKMFHREDEPLIRLFLNEAETRRIDRLWAEHRFISRQPVAEYDYLPQFMGFTTQDTPKEFQQFFIDRKPLFKKLADEFVNEEAAAQPKHLESLAAFASKAYRRPITDPEKNELANLYEAVRKKGATHEEAIRGVLARVLVSPAFLFRIEAAPIGKEPANVSELELASRLSYFLWSSMPDEELLALAATGKLRESLPAQVSRMLKDPRGRALAVEFGTQWLHVRDFESFNEKNEKLFPTFDAKLRAAMNEEAVQFFQDFFANDRAITSVLDADYVFVNDLLAKHYGIPNVNGPEFRRVEGVRKYGRGGILGFASVQAKQSGASRTSPVLRGNWVVETLLGEKLPKPPPNVPQLPAEEGADKLTTRQQVEKHAKDPACAVCHVRIDPFGFALEKFDAIGRFREKDLGGLAVDTKVKLKDATEFEGIDGLRSYLLAKKKDVIVRLFCKKLLGYALGRSVTLSDTVLLDEMVNALNTADGRVSAAIGVIVKSPQFQKVRGRDFGE